MAFPGDIQNKGLGSTLTVRHFLFKTRPIRSKVSHKRALVTKFNVAMVTVLGFLK